MSNYLEQIVKNCAVLTVKHLAYMYVTKLRGNVKVDVKLGGLNVNVTHLCVSDSFGNVSVACNCFTGSRSESILATFLIRTNNCYIDLSFNIN